MTKVPGRDVPCPGGYTAFVPDPFPPDVPWIPDLVRALSDADRMIGRLAGEGGRLPNPHLLIRPFLRREAVLSSRIEGTKEQRSGSAWRSPRPRVRWPSSRDCPSSRRSAARSAIAYTAPGPSSASSKSRPD